MLLLMMFFCMSGHRIKMLNRSLQLVVQPTCKPRQVLTSSGQKTGLKHADSQLFQQSKLKVVFYLSLRLCSAYMFIFKRRYFKVFVLRFKAHDFPDFNCCKQQWERKWHQGPKSHSIRWELERKKREEEVTIKSGSDAAFHGISCEKARFLCAVHSDCGFLH